MNDYLRIIGAKEHNLKNINLEIPKNKLIVITGISGSGKSSLAFDTIYAEGQRRYVESLSTYARQFLGVMDKPDVEKIEGLSPSISIDQKTASHNPRSTVGTITEIYDYLRVLFARIGHPHCSRCGTEITRLSVDEIVIKILKEIENELTNDPIKLIKFILLSPVVREKKGEFKDLFENLLKKGFQKVRVDGYFKKISNEINLLKNNRHSIDVVIDELDLNLKDYRAKKEKIKKKLSEISELSLTLSQGLVTLYINEKKEIIFSEKYSCPLCNLSIPELEPRMFSFNSPLGACQRCKGLGVVYKVNPDLVLNKNLSINEGAILPLNKIFYQNTWYTRLLKKALEEEGVDMNRPVKDLPSEMIKIILYGTNKVYRVTGFNRQGERTAIFEKFDGIIAEIERRFLNQDNAIDFDKYIKEELCPLCQGNRLSEISLAITIDKKNIAQITAKTITFLLDYYKNHFFEKISHFERTIAEPIIREILYRLEFLENVGLGYLTLNREAKTLAGGELQRIRLASQIGTGLTGVIYVLDEPSIGLHSRDVDALINTLKRLRDLGNTVIVVEHDRSTILAADYLVELGPLAGEQGGKIVYSGTVEGLKKAQTITSKYIFEKNKIPLYRKPLVKKYGELIIRGASEHNLKKITVRFPLGNLIGVSGVSGSGKSTLIVDTLYPALKYYLQGYYQDKIGQLERLEGYQYINRVYLVDQSPIGRTPRSNPATYVGFFDEIRALFAETIEAKIKGFNKGRFSFNLKGGRCEKCQGSGLLKIEMQFLSDVYVTCDVCQGRRYNQETLSVKFKDKRIDEVLKMTVKEAKGFFVNHYQVLKGLSELDDIGLGYLKLGQPATTLSGGEAQRIKLAAELIKGTNDHTIYILDEPTTGLHLYDIEKLIKVFYRLIGKGNTVIVIEHNEEVLKNCQYLIDLGPEGGDKGGEVVYQGPTEGICKEKKSYTGKYLRKYF